MKLIRKISIGQDYKNEAMHYSVGQEVYGGHTICDILAENDGSYKIYITKNKEVSPRVDDIVFCFKFLFNLVRYLLNKVFITFYK